MSALRTILQIAISLIMLTEEAMICDKSAAAQLFKVPENLECEEGHEKTILVELEKTNIKQYQVKATRLIVSEKTCKVSQQFFGAKETQKTEKRLLWTKEKYREHISTKTCVNTEGITVSQTGGRKPKCETKWMKTTTNTEIQCLYQEGYVTKSHEGTMISNLGDVHQCTKSYQEGLCITQNREAIHFIPNENVRKQYLEVGKFSAIQIGKHLIIGELGFSVNIGEEMKVDKYYERNGFRLKRIPTEELNQVQANLTSIDNAIETVRQELLTKLNFLSDVITLKTHRIKSLCEAVRMTLDMSKLLAVINPTAYARTLLHNRYLIAESDHITGTFIRITPCKNVTDVRFRKTGDERCYSDIPVTYKWGQIEHEGFLDTSTNVIALSAARVNCSKQTSKFVELNKQLYVYTPGTIPQRLNVSAAMEMPMFKTKIFDELFHFPDKFIYKKEEIIQIDEAKAAVEYLNDRLNSAQDAIEVLKDHQNPINSLTGFVKNKIEHVLLGLVEWMVRLGAVFGWIYFVKLITNSSILRNIPRPSIKVSLKKASSTEDTQSEPEEKLLQ